MKWAIAVVIATAVLTASTLNLLSSRQLSARLDRIEANLESLAAKQEFVARDVQSIIINQSAAPSDQSEHSHPRIGTGLADANSRIDNIDRRLAVIESPRHKK